MFVRRCTQCVQKVALLNVKPPGTYGIHWPLKYLTHTGQNQQ